MKKAGSGRRTFTVDLAGVRTAAKMHEALAAALPLPAHYGRNLDALHDVLAEYGGNWRIVFRNAGAVARGLRTVCSDAVAETPGLEISFEDRRGAPTRKPGIRTKGKQSRSPLAEIGR